MSVARGTILLPLLSALGFLGGLAGVLTAGDSSAIGFAAGMMLGQGMTMFIILRVVKTFGSYSGKPEAAKELTATIETLNKTLQFVGDVTVSLHNNMAKMLNEASEQPSKNKVA